MIRLRGLYYLRRDWVCLFQQTSFLVLHVRFWKEPSVSVFDVLFAFAAWEQRWAWVVICTRSILTMSVKNYLPARHERPWWWSVLYYLPTRREFRRMWMVASTSIHMMSNVASVLASLAHSIVCLRGMWVRNTRPEIRQVTFCLGTYSWVETLGQSYIE